jgi:outer membrane protein insertion porin family
MRAGTNILRAVSAVALSSTVLAATTFGAQIATVTVAEAAVVNRIDVRGNRRVEADTVRGFMQVSPGQNVSEADQDEAVRRLFSTGLFSDVRISQSGGTLIVQVEENQIVNQVLFQGNSKIKDDAAARSLFGRDHAGRRRCHPGRLHEHWPQRRHCLRADAGNRREPRQRHL